MSLNGVLDGIDSRRHTKRDKHIMPTRSIYLCIVSDSTFEVPKFQLPKTSVSKRILLCSNPPLFHR